ncbi:MAG: polysaccharide deacetylase family protein [Bacteroidota bacterium]|jgi:oligosaccharide reducing-end xylanase
MKHSLYTTVFIFLFNYNSFSQSIDAPYEVGTWQGFRTAAVSYTFDDNCANQLALVVPMFNEYGFQLTLFTVINWGPNWTGLQSAANKGHEIASHTLSHADLSTLNDSLQTIELKNSQATINAHITGQKCVTIAYPNCNVGNTSIIQQYYFAARICSGVIEKSTPTDFMRISSIICGTQGSVKTSADFKSRADAAVSAKGWCVYLIHAIDNDPGYSPIPSDTVRAGLVYLKANPDKFWVTSFGNVAKYICERNAAWVLESHTTEDSITVIATDTLDNSIYNCPITIRRPLPQNWSSAYVMQHGDTIASQIVEVNSTKYIMFDVIPDNGDITVKKVSATGVGSNRTSSSPKSFDLSQNYPNPFNPATQINYSVLHSSYITLKVTNLLGQEVATLFKGIRQPGNYETTFDGSKLTSGVYFYKLQMAEFTAIKKMLLLK